MQKFINLLPRTTDGAKICCRVLAYTDYYFYFCILYIKRSYELKAKKEGPYELKALQTRKDLQREIMISKNKIKHIRSLALKKNRKTEGVFVAEGPKTVGDILVRQRALTIVATDEWVQQHHDEAQRTDELIVVTEEELTKTSLQQNPQQVLAVFKQTEEELTADSISKKLVLALDGVQDPGNLGTIIRIADWFGIDTIVCSPDTADVYNPKVVQATMGSIARVRVVYTSLPHLVDSLPKDHPVFGTLLDGENIYTKDLPQHGIIVMGNEGNGISAEMRSRISQKLLIPTFATTADKADSLNVAVATAIVCSEFRR